MDDDLRELLTTVDHELMAMLRLGRAVSWEIARDVHPNLEPNSYALLLWLRRCGSTRLTDLAQLVGISKGTLSRQMQALEQLGLVERQPDPTDRRAALLSLSTEGQRRFDAARAARLAPFERTMAAWPREDLAVFARLLSRLNATER